MPRSLFTLMAVALSCGLLAAGCGDDGDGGGNGGNGADGGVGAQNREQAVDSCKQSIDNAPQLSDDVKSELKDICEESAEGDEDAVRDASRRVCVTIAEESVPEGPARQQALDACRQSGPNR